MGQGTQRSPKCLAARNLACRARPRHDSPKTCSCGRLTGGLRHLDSYPATAGTAHIRHRGRKHTATVPRHGTAGALLPFMQTTFKVAGSLTNTIAESGLLGKR